MAATFCRVDERAQDLISEAYPDTTDELLEDWERVAGLPDECSPLAPTKEERRAQLVQKITDIGGQNAAYFEEVASRLGFDVEVVDFKHFRVGQSRVGDALTNLDWTFWWAVKGPSTINRPFRVGTGRVGDRLVTIGNELLECTMKKLKPAHTQVLFIYE